MRQQVDSSTTSEKRAGGRSTQQALDSASGLSHGRPPRNLLRPSQHGLSHRWGRIAPRLLQGPHGADRAAGRQSRRGHRITGCPARNGFLESEP